MAPSASSVLDAWFLAVRDALGLADWTVIIAEDPAEDGYDAYINVLPGQRRAVLHLGERFMEEPPSEQRHTIVHELLHLHLHEVQAIVDRSAEHLGTAAGAILSTEHRNFLEHGVDAIATAISPLLPEAPNGTADGEGTR